MEKREFNKIVKQKYLSYGFEKTGPRDYAKEAMDGMAKIIVQVPDETVYFVVGVQFKDFGKTYTDYSGKFSKRSMAYSGVPRDLAFTPIADCSETQIIDMITTLMNSIEIFLQRGRDAIREHIDEWIGSVISEEKENDIYTYLGMPLINPYTKKYQDEWVSQMRGGGMTVITLSEYLDHKDFYDAFQNYDCVDVEIRIDEKDQSVTLHFHQKSQ
ncbi:MAG: hypothetical protein IJW70_03885 [Clostridia bacterium]|nr:hypothetical protein [Clostridia bacterium]